MYSSLIQHHISPAGYHRDKDDQRSYLANCDFLPYLNNEKVHTDEQLYKNKFTSLNFVTLIKFMYDPVIHPIESSWFGELDSQGNVIPMEQTQLYLQDLFGLRTIDVTGRLEKQIIDGVHL